MPTGDGCSPPSSSARPRCSTPQGERAPGPPRRQGARPPRRQRCHRRRPRWRTTSRWRRPRQGSTRRVDASAERRARRRAAGATQGARGVRPRGAHHVDADGARQARGGARLAGQEGSRSAAATRRPRSTAPSTVTPRTTCRCVGPSSTPSCSAATTACTGAAAAPSSNGLRWGADEGSGSPDGRR